MRTNRDGAAVMPVEIAKPEKIKCDCCKRELKSSWEWIRGDNKLLCETCYQNQLFPNSKIYFGE
jgi:hypothetical protein